MSVRVGYLPEKIVRREKSNVPDLDPLGFGSDIICYGSGPESGSFQFFFLSTILIIKMIILGLDLMDLMKTDNHNEVYLKIVVFNNAESDSFENISGTGILETLGEKVLI